MEKQVRVALFGHGFLGKWHAQKAHALENSKLTVIVEPYEAYHDDIKKLYPEAKVVKSVEGSEDLFDAAIIASPTSYHFELCEKLLKLSKHIFCEKPVTSTYAQAQSLRSLLREEKVFQVGHSERCHQVWEMRERFAPYLEGDSLIEFTRVAPFKGRATDVDVVQDLMIHDIDLMLWLTDEKPTLVEARGFKIRTDFWDHAWARFHFSSGKTVLITVGRNALEEQRTVQFTHSTGQLLVDLFRGKILESHRTHQEIIEGEYPKRDHLLIEQKAFYQSILKDEEAFVGFEDGKRAVYLVEKTLESIVKGKPVELKLT